jgi:hypothetical protein
MGGDEVRTEPHSKRFEFFSGIKPGPGPARINLGSVLMSSPEERMAAHGLKAEDFNFSGAAISADEKTKAQKIIDAALKLPDNRQCADCTSKGMNLCCACARHVI